MVLGRRVQIRCRQVYVATNGYTSNLHPYLHRIVRPVRGQVLITTPVERVIEIPALTEYNYFRQFPDGSILVGGSRLFFEKQEDTAEDVVTPDVLARIERYFRQWFPDIDFEIERTWAGIHGFTPDRRAAIGLIPDEPRIAFALGFSGYGNSIGLVSAERMVELVLDGRDPGPLSAARFD
jgi:glycine/D-amino acid oxidase-like deaminating enzyme